MMKQKILGILFLLLGVQLSAQAGSLQATGSGHTISAAMTQNIIGPLNFDASYTRDFQESNSMTNLGLYLEMGLGPVSGRAGVKTFYADVDGANGRGYAPGVGFSVTPIPMFSLVGSYYYANDKTINDNDIDRYRDWSLTVNFHPVSLTNLYVGYSYEAVDVVGSGRVTFNNGPIVGVSLNF